ncbi:MAG: DUF5012 domain-containing protein [Dysgonamonadaceae bacterium]|jgi:hypothetical protein|nr:DUF5012 domain-containing protein [Dysgonamonadaceae bacterium]
MKKIIYSMLLCGLVFAGCKDITTEDPSKITYFVDFEILGDKTFLVEKGEAFVDPGVIAKEGDVDVTANVKVENNVNTNELGVYKVTYSAINVDGFPASASRTVVVYNPAVSVDISGAYTVSAGSHRLAITSGAQVAYSGYPVNIVKTAPGIFYVSDFFGGYYAVRAGYGSSYAMTGYISLNEDNTIDLLSSLVNGWGDSLDDLADATYDPATETVAWGAKYVASYSFNVILNK